MDRTLLYIDPDPATRLLVRKVLAPEGFIVLQAKTALEGQQSAARTRPDLILVDVDLVKAAELVPALRQSPGLEHIRLLASTAHAWPEHLEKMIAWGFDRVLLKPLDVDTLGRELVSVLAPTEPAQPAPAEPATEPVEPATEPVEPAMELVEPAMEPAPQASGMQPEVADTEPDAIEAHAEVPEDEAQASEPPGVERELPGAERELPKAERKRPGAERELPGAEDELRAAPAAGMAEGDPSAVPVEVPPLWRLSLGPLTANLARATASTQGVLALLDDEEVMLTIAATASSPRAASVGRDSGEPLIGSRIPVRTAPWLHPVLRGRETVLATTETVPPSPLIPLDSHALLIMPVASREKVYGVAILGKPGSKSAAFGPGKVARGLSEARQIAGIVETLGEMNLAMDRKRREMEQLRRESLRGLLTEMITRARPSRRNGAGRERGRDDNGLDDLARARVTKLGMVLAEQLSVPPGERDALRQALEGREIGRAWVEHVLLSRGTFPAAERQRLLDGYVEHGVEILSALGWPSPVIELVRAQRAWWNGEGHPAGLAGEDIPLGARIMAVVDAYGNRTAPRRGSAVPAEKALAELTHQAGSRFDPDVVRALARLGPAASVDDSEDDRQE